MHKDFYGIQYPGRGIIFHDSTLCLKRHEVSEKIGLGSLAHFKVDMKQGKLEFLKFLNFVRN